MMKILFTGGGSGGHIFPIIATVRELWKIYPKQDLRFFYLGPKDELGSILLSLEKIEVKTIITGKVRRYFDISSLFQNLSDILFKIPLGICQSFYYLFKIRPDIIFSKGGYGALPVILANWLLRIPTYLHESDVCPGLTNRITLKILGKALKNIFISFPKTEYFPLEKMTLVGNPIRKEILNGSKEKAKILFKLNLKKPLILILGGSQGARRINDLFLIMLSKILLNFEIIHQCGEKNFDEVLLEAKTIIPLELRKEYHPFSFLQEEELKHAYQAADLIVSRAGAGIIFEIASLGKPSILIPLSESASDHQLKNAFAFAQAGATFIIEEQNLTPNFFLNRINYLFSNPEKLENMKKEAKKFSQPEAAQIIAKKLFEELLLKQKNGKS